MIYSKLIFEFVVLVCLSILNRATMGLRCLKKVTSKR